MTKSKKFTSILMGIAMVLMACGVCGVSFSPTVQNYSHAEITDGGKIDDVQFYSISSETDLQEIAKKIANGENITVGGNSTSAASANYVLARDIDLSGPNWVPIGTYTHPFTGKFNGNGFSIKGNITVDSSVWKPAAGEDSSKFVATAGVFGYTENAEIYDLVIGDTAGVNPFSGDNANNAGRLVGYAKNTTFIDVYDLSFINNSSTTRTLKTIGTAENCTFYDGDTFTYNGKTYKPGSSISDTATEHTYVKGSNAHPLFDIASEKTTTATNKSITLQSDNGSGIVYLYDKDNADAVKTNILPKKVAISTNGDVKKVYSNKYLSALPKELTGEPEKGTPIFLGNPGHKLRGWADSAGKVYADGSAIASASLSQYTLTAKTTKITYKLNIEIPGQDNVTKDVLYNSPWKDIYGFDKTTHSVLPSQAVLVKEGYDLLSVYEDKTTTQDTYITVDPQYDGETEGANKNFDVEYPKGEFITAWDNNSQDSETTITVNLKTTWQGAPIVSNLVFSNSQDTGVNFAGIVGTALVRNGKDEEISTTKLSATEANSQTYTFRAPADIELTYIVGLSLGYKIADNPKASVGTVTLVSSSDKLNGDTLAELQSKYTQLKNAVTFYKYTISGLVPGTEKVTPNVTFQLYREEISINVSAEHFSSVTVDTKPYTKIEGTAGNWTLKTRIGESFRLTATPEDGYEFSGSSFGGFTTFAEASAGAAGDSKAFDVTITTYEKGTKTITLNARAKSFTLELEYVAEDCNGAATPEFVFNGSNKAQNSQTFGNIQIAESYAIKSTGNTYYQNGVVTLESDDKGGAKLEGSGDSYTLTGVKGGATVKIKVVYKPKTFQASLSGKYADLRTESAEGGIATDTVKKILGVDGKEVEDNTVLTFTTVTDYKYKDEITLKAEFVGEAAKHYDFVGWFLGDGTYINSTLSTTHTAPAEALTIYAVIKGKSTTFTVQDGTYVENYNGQSGTWHNMNKNVATATSKSVVYTFSKPNDGTLTFGKVTGYNYKGFLIIKTTDLENISEAITKGNAWKVESSATSIAGYSTFQTQYNSLLSKTDGPYVIMPYAEQQKMTIHFTNDVTNKEFETKTYYYDTELSVTDLKTKFDKPGYTATGWSVYTSSELTQSTTTLDDKDSLNLNSVNFADNGNLYLVRTYQINTYKVYFSKEEGVPQVKTESGNNVLTESESVMIDGKSVQNYNYINVDYQTAFNLNSLPMFDKPGYYLTGFEVVSTDGNGETWDSETPFKFTQNVIVKPLFAGGKFTVTINENGGTATDPSNKTVTLEVDKTLGTTELFTATSDEALATKLASMFTRAGFKVTGLHFLTTTGSTYKVGGTHTNGKVEYNDKLNPDFFGKDHFKNTADKGKNWTTDITLYCRWEFDGSEEVKIAAAVSGNFTGSPIEQFNPQIKVGETTFTWNTDNNTLNTKDVAISEYHWYYCGTEMSGSQNEFAGTKTAKSPSLIHVSQSGYYKVAYILVDTKTVTAEGFDADKSKSIEMTAKATINPVAAKFAEGALPNEMLADALKDRLTANSAVIKALTDSTSYSLITRVIAASSAKDITTVLGEDADAKKSYLVSLILVSDILVNKNIANLYGKLLAGTDNETIVETIASKNLTEHRSWLKNLTAFKAQQSKIEAFNAALTPCLYAKTYNGESDYLTNYATSVFALNYEGGSTITSGVTATIVDSKGTDHSDVNVTDFTKEDLEQGKALKLTVTLNEGFEATDFTNLVAVSGQNGKYTFTHTNVPSSVYGLIMPGVTSFNLTLTKGVGPENHTQVLESPYGYTDEFQKIEVTVEPESTDAGVYSFFGGEGHRLLIKSYKLYTAGNQYYTVTITDDGVQIDNNGNTLQLSEDKLKNLSLYVDGEYEIISVDTMPKTEISAQTLTASEDNTKLNIALKEINVKLKSVTFNNGTENKTVTVSGNYVMDTVDGTQKLIAQISGNDSQTVIIYVSEYVTKLTFEIANDENAVFIGVHETKKDVSGYYEGLLKEANTLSPLAAEYTVTKGELPATLGAIFTKATHVTHAWTSDGTKKTTGKFDEEFDRYVNFNGTYTVPLEAMYKKEFPDKDSNTRAYVYGSWVSDGFTAAGNEITNNSKSLNATITATKSLAAPTLNKDTLSITDDYATAFYAAATDLLTDTEASVQNQDESLNYAYKIYKQNEDSEETEQSHIAWTTASNGTYRIEIIVTDKNNNYKEQKSDKTKYILTLKLKKTPLSLALSTTYSFDYDKTDHKSKIQATLSSEAFEKPETRALFAEHENGFGSLFTFEIKKDETDSNTIQNAGAYSIVATLKSGPMTGGFDDENFEDVFEFTTTTFNNIVVNKATIELTDQVLRDNHASFKKAVGDSDPTLTFTYTTTYDEQVQITLVRDKASDSEKAGTYKYTGASVDNENYQISFKVSEEKFTIEKASYGITATLSETQEFVYDGEHTYTATIEYNAESDQWEIKLNKDGKLAHTYTLSNLKFTGASGKAPKVDKNTLNGATLTIGGEEGKIKDVGDYKFTVSGTLSEYTGALTLEGNPVAVRITKKTINLSDVSREFDNTDSFNFTYTAPNGGDQNNGTTATLSDVVAGDKVILTGKFTTQDGQPAKVGENLKIAELKDTNSNNYTVVLSGSAKIEKSSQQITMEVTGLDQNNLTFTYGKVSEGLEAILSKITAKNGDTTTFKGYDLSGITKKITFNEGSSAEFVGTHKYLKAKPEGYNVTLSFESDYFANLESKAITLIVNQKQITIDDDAIDSAKDGKFTKAVGEAFKNPTFTYTDTDTQESVTITLIVTIDEDKKNVAGDYPYSNATVSNNNYKIDFKVENKKFTITEAAYGITAVVSGAPHNVTYDGEHNYTAEFAYNENSKKWEIKLYKDEARENAAHTYTLELKPTVDGNNIVIDKYTLAGATLTIGENGVVTNQGDYKFKIGGNLAQYSGTLTLENDPVAIHVNKKALTLSNVSREFDNSTNFSFTFTGPDGKTDNNNGTKATLTGVVGTETVTITGQFSALVGTDLTISQLKVTNSENYTISLSDKATIKKSSKTITIEVDSSTDTSELTFTYGGVDQSLSAILNKITLKIDDKTQFNGYDLSQITKKIAFATETSANYVGNHHYLKAKTDGYNITISLSSEYFDAEATKELKITVNKRNIEITDEIIEAAEGNFSKFVGDEFTAPTFSYTDNGEGGTKETITITLQVNFAGGSNDTAGKYPYSSATVSDTDNYTATLKSELTSKYEIKEAEFGITATIDSTKTLDYDGEHTYTAKFFFDQAAEDGAGQWKIKLYKDDTAQATEFHTYALTLSFTGSAKPLKVDANTLAGATLTIGTDGKVKDVGDYKFVVAGDLSQYTGTLTFTNDVAIRVNKKQLTLKNVSREYDTTTEFNYNTETSKSNGTTATVEGVVQGETVQITGTFSANIGSELKITELSVTNSNNYTVSHSDTATINPSKAEITITVEEIVSNEQLKFTYGDVDNTLKAILDKIKLTIDGKDTFHEVALSTLIKPKIAFTRDETDSIFVGSHKYLKASDGSGYKVKISIENVGAKVFEANQFKDINILVNKKNIEITDEIISKSNGVFFKYVGDAFKDPTFEYTDNGEGGTKETITIKLTVDFKSDGNDKVGKYNYSKAEVIGNDNYTASLKDVTKQYEIKQAEQGVRATLTYESGKVYEFTYKGETTITPKLEFENGEWKIKLYEGSDVEGEAVATYVLKLKLTGDSLSLNVDGNTLKGIENKISIKVPNGTNNTLKNAGDYYFDFGDGDLTQYTGKFELLNNPVAVRINKHKLTFTKVEKEFDNTTEFSYKINNGDNTGLTVTGTLTTINSEPVTITGTFGGNFGEVGLTGLKTSDSNYYIDPTFADAKIVKSSKTVTIEVAGEDNLSFEYGKLDKKLEEIRKLITLKIDKEPTFGEAQVSSFITEIQLTGPRDDDYTQIGKLKAKDGAYQFTITLVTDKFTVNTKEINVTVTKKDIALTNEDIQDYFKYVGENDPSLKFDKQTELGEYVTIKLTRAAGEAVNTYAYTNAEVFDHNTETTSGNYTVSKNGVSKIFEIKKSKDGITASLDKTYSFTYGEHKDVTAELKFEDGAWKIELKEGEQVLETYTLTLNRTGKSGDPIKADNKTLDGIKISIDGTVKNAGIYNFKIGDADGSGNKLTQYEGAFTFAAGTHAVEVKRAQITVSNVSREFDNTDDFKFTYVKANSNADSNGTTATISGVVDGDTVTLTGKFKKAEASAIIGTDLTLTDLQETSSSNYTVVFSGTAEIKKSTKEIKINVDGSADTSSLTFTYGEVTEGEENGPQAILEKISLKNGETTTFEGVELSQFIKTSLTFSESENIYVDTYKYLKAKPEGYSVTINLTSDYFENINSKTITVVVNKKAITITDDIIDEAEGKFFKYVGDDFVEPKFSYTDNGTSESVEITLGVEIDEEKKNFVGFYPYDKEKVQVDNDNYAVSLDEHLTKQYEIRQAMYGIDATLTYEEGEEPYNFEYKGATTISPSLVFEDGQWKIKLYQDGNSESLLATYTLTLKRTGGTEEVKVDKYNLHGLSIVIIGQDGCIDKIKDVGDYRFTIIGKLTQFTGAFNLVDNPVAVRVDKRMLTLSKVTKEFDNTTNFTYNTSNVGNDGVKATVQTVVDGESVVIKGTFKDKFGKVGLTGLTVSDDNYDIASELEDAEIIQSTKQVNIEVSGYKNKLTYTYGEVDNNFSNIRELIKLTIDEGSESLNGTAIKDGLVTISFEGTALSDFSKIQKLNAKSEDYTLTIKLSSQYFANLQEKQIVVHINKLEQSLKDGDINDVQISKFFGEEDPNFTFTYRTTLNEDIEVTLVREKDVEKEKLGSYDFTNATTTDNNYDIKINEITKKFTINKSEDGITATFEDQVLTFAYGEKQGHSVELKFDEGNTNKWQIVITSGEEVTTYTLKLALTGDAGKEITVNKYTLDGVSIKLDKDTVKAAGDYHFVVENDLTNYSGKLTFANDLAIKVNKAKLTVSDAQKEFDNTTSFEYHTDGKNNAQGVQATVAGLVNKSEWKDDVTITGSFSDKLGDQLQLTLEVDNPNYEFTRSQIQAKIVKSSKKVDIEIKDSQDENSKLTFAYGDVSEGLEAISSKIILKVDGETDILGDQISGFVKQVSLSGTQTTDFSNSKNLKAKDNYQITIHLESDYFTTEDKTITVIVNKKQVKITPESGITKIFDNKTNVIGEFTIDGLEEGDQVNISNPTYASAEISDNIAISFTISGDDVDNYEITNRETIKGAITEKSILIQYIFNPSNTGDGAGVSVDESRNVESFVDGQSASLTGETRLALPYDEREEKFEALHKPTKKGYDFVGWYYFNEDNYTLVNDGNTLYEYLLKNVDKPSIKLYAAYTIKTYKVEVALGEGGKSYNVTEEGKVEGTENTYTYKYYSNITITGVAKSGYHETNSPQQIPHIEADHTGESKISLEFYAVSVQFTITISRSDLYQRKDHVNSIQFTKKNEPYDWKNGADGQATLTIAYNVLSGVSLADFLPTITIEGYNLKDGGTWKNGSHSFTANSTANVQTNLVDVINGDFHNQISIELTLDKASLEGKQHTIILKAGDGHFGTEQEKTKEVTKNYGEDTKVSEFDKPTRVGYEFKGWTYQSNKFDDTTDPKYGYDANIELDAVWEVQSFTLTLNLTKVTVIVSEDGGQIISPNGQSNEYELVYNKKYNITVTAAAGYEIKEESWSQGQDKHYKVTDNGDKAHIQITELSQNDEFDITAFARENHLTISINDESTKVAVTCDGEAIEITENYYKVLTDKTIKITLTPTAGHSVKSATVVDRKGKIELKEGAWELTGFTSDLTVTFDVQPDDVTATINIDGGVEAITITENGRPNDHDSSKYTISTTVDKELKLSVKLNAGYEFKSITGTGYTESHEVNLDKDSDIYTITVTLSKFTADFTVTITTEKREYNMTAKVVVINRDNEKIEDDGFTATVNENETAKVKFTETAQFKTSTTQQGYIFVGWFEGDLSAGVEDYDLASGVKDKEYTYTVNNPKDTTFTAVWRLGLFIVTAKVGEGKGTISVENKVVTQNGGNEYRKEIIIGNEITLVAKAAEGYAIKGWTLDGNEYQNATDNNSTIKLTIGETDYNFVVNFKPLPVKVNVQSKVSINNEFKNAENTQDAKHGHIEWAYDIDDLENGSGNINLSEIESETDKDVYFKVTVNNGYEFDNFYTLNDDDESAPIDPVDGKDNIYKLTGLIGEEGTKTYNFYARFVATVGNFTIKFIDEKNQQVDAGRISVLETSLSNIQSNNNSTVYVSAVTGSGFDVTVHINIGYKFAQIPVVLQGNYAKINSNDVKADGDILTTGHSYVLTFLVTDVVGGDDSESVIEIHVIPETYKVRLNATEVWQEPKDYSVALGGYIENLNAEDIIPVKDGYEFVGFYTYVNGGGTQYIDKTGKQIKAWNESGYTFNGETYSISPNFQNGYINLYADFIIKKTEINVQVIPDALKGVEPYSLKVKNLIQNFNDNATWTKDGEEFDYIAEVLFKTAVTIEAYASYPGYKFDRWLITGIMQDGTEGSPYTDSMEDMETLKNPRIENLKHDGFVTLNVKALYLANITLDVNDTNGGDVEFIVDGETVDGQSMYLQGKKVTLHAIPKPGYKFIKWVNTKTSQEYLQDTIELSGELVPSDFVAYFEGLPVSVEIVLPTEHGQIDKVTLYHAGAEAGEFTKNDVKFAYEAQVGDEVRIFISKEPYYEVEWNVANITNKTEYYSYIVQYNEGQPIVLTPTIVQIHCDATLRVTLQGVNNDSELNLAGVVRYRKPNEAEWNTFTGTSEPFDTYAGGKLYLDIRTAPNYRIARVSIQVPDENGTYRDVTSTFGENGIDLVGPNGELFKSFVITVVLARDMWIDKDETDHVLSGNGADSNPYLINNVDDLIYMAQKINREGNAAFANASYKLNSDIDLTGKFWSPIGTERNKFNGKFDFGTHKVTGITLTPTAISLEHHYNGLFGFMTGKAKIVEQNQQLMIALVTVGAILVAIAIALLIFFLVRRQRKKKMEELQNS